jgi:hypothetical protein
MKHVSFNHDAKLTSNWLVINHSLGLLKAYIWSHNKVLCVRVCVCLCVYKCVIRKPARDKLSRTVDRLLADCRLRRKGTLSGIAARASPRLCLTSSVRLQKCQASLPLLFNPPKFQPLKLPWKLQYPHYIY